MNAGSVEDRRESKRHEFQDTFYVTFRPYFDRIGKLTDISRNGIAFEYPAYESYEQKDCVEVDIFSLGDDLHVSSVPCKVIYDIVIVEHPSFTKIATRRCGLQFQELTPLHVNKLKSLVNNREHDFAKKARGDRVN
jgi:c-di-GMP-binding flagellar brake protein YcgR